jgi:hypothetical protein
MYVVESCCIAHSNTLEPDGPQDNRLDSCVIAQQHASATFVSLRVHSRKEKFRSCVKKYCYSVLVIGPSILVYVLVETQRMHQNDHFIVMASQTFLHVLAY